MKPKIVKKPWGHEVIFAHERKYAGKILVINKGHRLSLQYHTKKHETVYVLRGRLLAKVGWKWRIYAAGHSIILPPRTEHRFSAPYGRVTLIEVSTPELGDVIRLADDYGRVG